VTDSASAAQRDRDQIVELDPWRVWHFKGVVSDQRGIISEVAVAAHSPGLVGNTVNLSSTRNLLLR
jgi:hypothetical protein